MYTGESKNDFIAGAVSGGLGVIVGNPLDVVKVRLQTSNVSKASLSATNSTVPNIDSIYHNVMQLIRVEGVTSLFRGTASPLVSMVALNSLLFVTYSQSLNVIQHISVKSDQDTLSKDTSHPQQIDRPLAHVFLAGLMSGFCCYLISTPTELIKCRAQAVLTPSNNIAPSNSRKYLQPHAPVLTHSLTPFSTISPTTTASRRLPFTLFNLPRHNSLAIFMDVAKNGGLRGFYRGGLVTLLRDGPGYAVYFGTYEWTKRTIRQNDQSNSISEHFTQLLAGGISGVASWASIYPLDVIKSRIQTTIAQPSLTQGQPNLFNVALNMYRREGHHVFFRGMTATLIRAFYVNAVVFVTYERCMKRLER